MNAEEDVRQAASEIQKLENYAAQGASAEVQMAVLTARLRNLAGDLEAQGWSCTIEDGTWVFRSPPWA